MRLKRWLALFFCGILGGVVFLFVSAMRSPYGLGRGGVVVDREYYTYSASSQAKIVKELSFADYFFLKGECYTLCFSSQADAEEYVLCLLREKGAQTVFEEEVSGVHSIYAYTDGGGRGVLLFGGRVNLHLAIRGAQVQVGAPIIFGGY